MSDVGHNSTDPTQLARYVERIERVNEEIKDAQSMRSEIFKEAKSNGYDLPALRALIKERAEDEEKRTDRENMLRIYKAALGALAELPLGKAAMERAA